VTHYMLNESAESIDLWSKIWRLADPMNVELDCLPGSSSGGLPILRILVDDQGSKQSAQAQAKSCSPEDLPEATVACLERLP
jgi:hypothetical protein